MDQQKSFFARLFDFSFSEFITMSVIRVLYVIAVIASAIGALMMLVTGLMSLGESVLRGLGMIILSPIMFILYVICARIWFELILIIFRIEEHTEKIAGAGQAAPPPPSV
ncbi:MAG: DUF4282 domain-containing protein [Armatimonadota bacterium]